MVEDRKELLSASEKRVARRSYKADEISANEEQQIQKIVDEINAESGLNIKYCEDGVSAFLDTNKLHKNAKALFLLKGKNNLAHLEEKCGYFGEKLVLKMTNMGFGTCFVGIALDKEKLKVPKNETLVCAVLIGHVGPITLREKVISFFTHLNSKKVKDMLVSYHETPEWVLCGMNEVLRAPSAKNHQKSRFVSRRKSLKITTYEDYRFDLVDMGIAKLHFELGAGKGHFPLGNNVNYILDEI